MRQYHQKRKIRIVDLCCGVGLLICALQSVVFDAEGVIGVDGSPEMISTANFLSNPKCCSKQNFVEYLGFYFSGLSEIFARQGVTAKRCTNVQLFW
jgi:ubiquinone/menaquinone biosynthesis C-methylase UbiE